MKNRPAYFFLALLLCLSKLESQTDSLKKLLNQNLNDTTRYNVLMALGNDYQEWDPDSAIYFHAKARMVAEERKDEIQMAVALKELALDNLNLANYETSLALYAQSLSITETFKGEKNLKQKARKISAGTYGGMGTAFYSQGDFSKALEYYFRALKVNEELGNKKGQGLNLNNIGVIYLEQSDFSNARRYYLEAYKIHEKIDSKKGMSAALGNIGLVYMQQGDSAFKKGNAEYAQGDRYPNALAHFYKALKIDEEIQNKIGLSRNYSNIAIINIYQGDSAMHKSNENYALKVKYPFALSYFQKAYAISEQMGDVRSQAHNLANIGSLFTLLKKYGEAEVNLKRSFKLAEEVGSLDDVKQAHEFLKDLYEATNRPALALLHFKLFIQFNDSIKNEEATRNIIQQEYKFNYEKKFAADSVNFAKEKKMRETEIARQNAEIKVKRNQQYALAGGLAMVIIFSVFLYSRFRITRQQQNIIQAQKDIVDEKQKQILDSIHYAKRIQRSLLPTEKYFEKNLKMRRS